MKLKFSIFLIILLAFIVSGCTPFQIQNKKQVQVTDGGVFKSTDFGENWTQKADLVKGGNKIGSIKSVSTKSIVDDPKDIDKKYLITYSHGIFVTHNNGENWEKTTITTGNIKSFAIDNRNNKVIYLTGGKTIKKSVDGMKTWIDIYIENRPQQTLSSLLVDKFDPSIIYAATTSSLIKSTDYGNHWNLLNWNRIKINSIFQSYRQQNKIYAYTNNGFYLSIDGGESWQPINDDLEEKKLTKNIVSVNFNPENDYFHIGTKMGIYRSLDGGYHWESIPTLFDLKKITIKTITYNPLDLDEIIFSYKNIIYKTEDNGVTWKTLKTVPTSRNINYIKAEKNHFDVILLGIYQPPRKK